MKRIKQNRRRRIHSKNKKKRNWFAPFGILLVLSSLVYIPKLVKTLGTGDFSKIKNLRILGANTFSSLDIQNMSGLFKGMKLSNKAAVSATKKIQDHPRFSQVTIMKDVTGEVVIKVQERKSAAMIQSDKLYYVDSQGRVLDEVVSAKKNGDSYPMITGDWKKGETEVMAAEGMAFRNKLVESGLDEKKISELHFDANQGWILYQVDFKVPVIFGHENFEEKTARLLRLLEKFRARENTIDEIDLDFKSQAIVKLKDAA